MTPDDPSRPGFSLLLSRLTEDGLTSVEFEQLGQILETDVGARAIYRHHILVHAMLYWRWHNRDTSSDLPLSPPSRVGSAPRSLAFLSTTLHNTLSYFPEGMLQAYLIATVVTALGLWICSHIYMSEPEQIVTHSLSPTIIERPLAPETLPKLVGRITGMVDCKWAKEVASGGWRVAGAENPPSTIHHPPSLVSLGDKLLLSSGLMEITYNTGAKVILQGPVTFEVESNGGYLAVGKLTGKLEKSGEWRVESGEGAVNQKSETRNQKPSRSTIHYPLFTIRTPTATVTDLGTEFGVEVTNDGITNSHVFQGTVSVQVIGGNPTDAHPVVLHKSESARVGRSRNSARPEIVVACKAVAPGAFVRQIVKPLKPLDLLDIVAGGYGTGNRRGHGIDPTSGREEPLYAGGFRSDNRQYKRIDWHKLIDGVFVPAGGASPVTLDSAGHTFDGFPKSEPITWGPIWSRGLDVPLEDRQRDINDWVFSGSWNTKELMPKRQGFLGLHANAGITFDLEAIRKIRDGVRPSKFQAVVSLVSPVGLADFWVFVDGQLKFQRKQFRLVDDVVPVEADIGPRDHFLTIAVSDGGDGVDSDWVAVGDPRLEMTFEETAAQGGH